MVFDGNLAPHRFITLIYGTIPVLDLPLKSLAPNHFLISTSFERLDQGYERRLVRIYPPTGKCGPQGIQVGE